MKSLIASLAFAFCLNAAATSFESAEKAWGVCAPVVREHAQRLLDEQVHNSSNPTLRGELGSVYDIHSVGGDSNVVESTTFYTLTWRVAAEGMPKNYSYGEFEIRAEAIGSSCRILK